MSYARKSDIGNLSNITRPLLKKPRTCEVRPPKFIAVYDNGGISLKVPTVIGFSGPQLEDAQKALRKMMDNGQIISRYHNGIRVIENPDTMKGTDL